MDLREAMVAEESLRAAEVDWRLRVRGGVDERLLSDLRQAVAVREAYLRMAEAALAYMEYQATSVHDPDECDLDRAQQRAKLWDAFMEARAKAKAVGQS